MSQDVTTDPPDVVAGVALTEAERARQRDVYAGWALGLLTLLLYLQTAGFSFVLFDDPDYASSQPMVLKGFTWEGVKWAFTNVDAANWFPLTWFSHMLDVELFGFGAGWPHVHNALLHAGNSVLVFVLLRRLSATLWPAVLVTGLFAWHPLRAESVAWVSERKDVLCALLYLMTIHLYLTYARDRTTRNYVAVLGMLILALLAKPMAVTIPAVLMLLDYWPLDRLQRGAWKRALLEKLPMWFIVAAACAVTLYAQSSGGAVVAKDDIPVDVRIASSVIAYVTYLQQTLVPTGLGAFYPQISMVDTDRLALGVTLPRVVLLGALTALVLLLRRGFPYLPVAWFWYVGTLVPVIGLVQVGAQSHADRYTYLPTVGLCIGLAVALSRAGGAMGRAVLPTVVAGLIVANVVLYGLAYRQIGIWRDSKTLMGHTASVVPGSYFAKSMLASILITEDRRDEAERLVRSSLRDNPRHAYTYGVLATVYAEDKDYARAVRAARVGALMDVSSAASWGGYAFMLDRAGEYDLAVGAYRRAISIQPKDPLHKGQLAAVLAKRGNFDEAMDLWREAIAINPNAAIFRFGYGLALVIRNQPGAGISELREAVRLDPTEPDPLRQLAWILATHPDARWQDGPEAVRLAERALMESDRPTAELLDTLAAAHARAGNWPTAVRAADQALQLARTERRTDLVERISHRLTLYNARQAFPR